MLSILITTKELLTGKILFLMYLQTTQTIRMTTTAPVVRSRMMGTAMATPMGVELTPSVGGVAKWVEEFITKDVYCKYD